MASIFILVVAALFGIQKHQRLVSMRGNHAELVAAAAQVGISVGPSNSDDPVRITRRERKNEEAEAKLVAAQLIALSNETEAIEKEDRRPDATERERIREIMGRVGSLDSTQLKILIDEVRATKNLNDETRQRLIGFSFMTLSNDHPQAALSLFTEAPDLLSEAHVSENIITTLLTAWAKDDPLAALEWVKKHTMKYPNLITDEARQGMIFGVASRDPKLAFELASELQTTEGPYYIRSIILAAETPEERTTALTALRQQVATLPDENAKNEATENAITIFGQNAANDSFAAGTKWIAEANLNVTELESFSRGLSASLQGDETGKWIEWLGENLPPEKSARNINNLVRSWTRDDYQAAGNWLTTTAPGPTKNEAIRSYAETVTRYAPLTAAQWAMILPPGKNRDQTLNKIFQSWPKNDAPAREAFKQEYGIK
jgi:hypothetical protein